MYFEGLVLLIRPQEQPLDIEHAPVINHILIPLDGSPLAEHMLTHATALGRLVQAEYTLLQAIEPVYMGYGTELYGVGVNAQGMEQLRTQAQEYGARH